MSLKQFGEALAVTVLALVLTIVFNILLLPYLGELSLFAGFGITTLILWPTVHFFLRNDLYMKIFYKINSTAGIRSIDKVSGEHPSFWTAVGDVALMSCFGGLGTAFCVNNREAKGRGLILASLVFLVVFVYLGPNVILLFPIGIGIHNALLPFLVGLLSASIAYKLSQRLSKKAATLLAFILSIAFFGSAHFMVYYINGDPALLVMGVMLGVIGLPANIVVPLTTHGVDIITGMTEVPGLNPGYLSTENGMPVLKYAGTDLSIPIFPDLLAALIVGLILHELFHGLVARAQGIKIMNTGLLFMSIFPMGAFVEPDEKKFNTVSRDKQLRVFAVGSFANMFVVGLSILLLSGLLVTSGAVNADGFIVGNVINGSPADGLFFKNDVVKSVAGQDTPTFTYFSEEVMYGTSPGQNVTIVTANRTFEMAIGSHPDENTRGYIGLYGYNDPLLSGGGLAFSPGLESSHLEPSLGTSIFNTLKWAFFLNMMLGLMNLLPLFKGLDGFYVYASLFAWVEDKFPRTKRINLAKNLTTGFVFLLLAFFFINFTPFIF